MLTELYVKNIGVPLEFSEITRVYNLARRFFNMSEEGAALKKILTKEEGAVKNLDVISDTDPLKKYYEMHNKNIQYILDTIVKDKTTGEYRPIGSIEPVIVEPKKNYICKIVSSEKPVIINEDTFEGYVHKYGVLMDEAELSPKVYTEEFRKSFVSDYAIYGPEREFTEQEIKNTINNISHNRIKNRIKQQLEKATRKKLKDITEEDLRKIKTKDFYGLIPREFQLHHAKSTLKQLVGETYLTGNNKELVKTHPFLFIQEMQKNPLKFDEYLLLKDSEHVGINGIHCDKEASKHSLLDIKRLGQLFTAGFKTPEEVYKFYDDVIQMQKNEQIEAMKMQNKANVYEMKRLEKLEKEREKLKDLREKIDKKLMEKYEKVNAEEDLTYPIEYEFF